MKFNISEKIAKLYKDTHKNYEYALESIMNGMDPNCCETGLMIVNGIKVDGLKSSIELSAGCVENIKELLNVDTVDDSMVEKLLWIAILFPEI